MLEFSVHFEVPASCLYEALTVPQKFMQFTRAPARITAEPGAEFAWLDGRITGRFLALEKDARLAFTWKMADWAAPSEVDLRLENWEDSCRATLRQKGLPPKEDPAKVQAGWMAQVFEPMSQILGYPIKK
jgi:activator of HSP90 ATPase